MDRRKMPSILLAVLAAVLFGASAPLSKQLLGEIEPMPLASLLYFGCGIGVLLFKILSIFFHKRIQTEAILSKKDVPWMLGVIACGGVAAPVILMYSLKSTPAATASLLLNFEAVSTALIAAFFFKEPLGKRIWVSVGLITLASIILSWSSSEGWGISIGALGIVLACILWGLDNNFTRNISSKDPLIITVCKGLGAGTVSLILSLILHSRYPAFLSLLYALILGAFCYGISIVLFVLSMRNLGAARTSAFFGTAPFIGSVISVLIFGEIPTIQFFISLPFMILGAFLIAGEKHSHIHIHEPFEHDHKHCHDDRHHNHTHAEGFTGEHTHIHTHEALQHEHPHTPDIHHRHGHTK